jgi:hypothetical protein
MMPRPPTGRSASPLRGPLRQRHLHAAPAAAGRRLDEHRIADVIGDLSGLGDVADRALRARYDRQPEGLGGALGLDLVAHDPQMLGRGADEGDVMLAENFGKAGILGEKAVTGMDGVGAGDLAGCDQRGDVEIALGGRWRSDAHAFIGQADVHGVFVGRGMNGHGLDAEFSTGAQHPQSDLAPVGDQDLVEHAGLEASCDRIFAERTGSRPQPRGAVLLKVSASIPPSPASAYGASLIRPTSQQSGLPLQALFRLPRPVLLDVPPGSSNGEDKDEHGYCDKQICSHGSALHLMREQDCMASRKE